MESRSDCYVDPPDIPAGMTIAEYRRTRTTRAPASRPGLTLRLPRRSRARRRRDSR